jgi:membrane associated rhomboid family serine protease
LFTGMAAVTGDYVLLSSDFPSVGASGAVFGLMGAYLILFPGQRIRCLWFGMAFFRSIGISIIRVFGVKRFRRSLLVPIPAFVLMLLYGLSDLVLTFESAQTGELVGRVNYVAHAFGFVSACTILLFVRKDLLTRYLAGRKL